MENYADGIGGAKARFVSDKINKCLCLNKVNEVAQNKSVCCSGSDLQITAGGVLNKSLRALTGSLSLSGMLSMDILEPGLDSDSRSSLDLRNVS